MKRCSHCGQLLPESEFYKNSYTKDRLRPECKQCTKEYQHTQQSKESNKKYRKSPKGKYTEYKRHAKERNIKFNISLKDFITLINQSCYYCGKYPANGLDRIDSSKGYTLDNVVPCCKYCNRAKSDLSLEEFFGMIKHIARRHNLC